MAKVILPDTKPSALDVEDWLDLLDRAPPDDAAPPEESKKWEQWQREVGQWLIDREQAARKIEDAILDGNLSAKITVRDPPRRGGRGGYRLLTDRADIYQIRRTGDGGSFPTLDGKDVRFFIEPSEMAAWLAAGGVDLSTLSESALLALDMAAAANGAKPDNETPTETKRALLVEILDEIERRAEKLGETFDRQAMPGRKIDFQQLCQKKNKEFRKAPSTFNDYLAGLCTFCSGARETDFYRRMFPEHDQTPAP